MRNLNRSGLALALLAGAVLNSTGADAPPAYHAPSLPDGKTHVTDTTAAFLKAPPHLAADVAFAKTPPTVELMYYPGQTYPGNPWSAWGDSLVADGKYYSSIGDHLFNAFLFEYDPSTHELRKVLDAKALLALPPDHYTPGKFHSRIDVGSDGCLYLSTHRGSARYTTEERHYAGDWILTYCPASGVAEVVARGPVGKESIPVSVLDPDRMIFYGGTAQSGLFFAYDLRQGKVRFQGPLGPYRYMLFARSTGRVYYLAKDYGELRRYDPEANTSTVIDGTLGLRTASQETPDGYVYTVSGKGDGKLFRFDVKTEQINELGTATIGTCTYVTSLDADPTGRYLYYCPGSHGNSHRDGSPVIQFDTRTRTRKVLAFLDPFCKDTYGFQTGGTYGTALSADGGTLFITWHGYRQDALAGKRNRSWACALSVVHIPESERRP